jgi:3-methylcrotonyl-CoA carboxylase alpha subunit
VRPLGDGRFLVCREDGSSVLAYAIREGANTWVFVDGFVHVLDSSRSVTATRSRSADPAALAAPMPATVVSIDVEAGQQVKTGDTLIVLEAMKMELTISAPREGRITAIRCKAGDLVQPGVPLAEME